MLGTPRVKFGLRLLAAGLCFLLILSTAFAQRSMRIGPGGASVLVNAVAPCSNSPNPEDGVTVDPTCCSRTTGPDARNLKGCFGNVMRAPDPINNPTWIEAIHSALMPTGDPTVPQDILGYVITWDFGDYVPTPAPPKTTMKTKLWNSLCRYAGPYDPSSPTCFSSASGLTFDITQQIPGTRDANDVNQPTATIFCAGHSFLDDGRLLVVGGDHLRSNTSFPLEKYGMAQGPRITYTFNALQVPPATPTWDRVTTGDLKHPVRCLPGPVPDLTAWPNFDCNDEPNRKKTGANAYDCTNVCINGGRFYPTNVSLKIGTNPTISVLTFSGYNQHIFPTINTFGSLTRRAYDLRSFTNELYSATSWSYKHLLYGFVDTFPGLTYPRVHLFPRPRADVSGDGKIFYVSYNEPFSYLYDQSKNEETELNAVWTKKDRPPYYRFEGSSVLLPLKLDGTGLVISDDVKVLSVGGCDKGEEPCRLLNNADRYSNTATMNQWSVKTLADSTARQHANAVLLPDGKAVVLGGESASGCLPYPEASPRVCPPAPPNTATTCMPLYTAQLYDPGADTWGTVPAHSSDSHKRARQYHSTAVLLQDGTVVMAGGDSDRFCNCPTGTPANNCPAAQLYFPPYMFRGTRPEIVATGPGSVARIMTIGSTTDFEIPTNTARYPTTSITKAVLIRNGAVTHSFDMSQRYLELTINSRTMGSVFVRPPQNATIAPPGYYTLWISVGTDINEIPSQWGELIKLQ